MKSICIAVVAVLISLSAAQAQTSAPATQVTGQRADVAAVKVSAKPEIVERFLNKHAAFLARAKEGNVDLLFLGDSITEGWAGKGKDVWKERYANLHPANFGISGDRTQHVLWRIENGELEGIKPKVVVLMIGTNNIGKTIAGSDPAPQIANGVKKIVDTIRAKTDAKVLLLAIFPRGENIEIAAEARLQVAQVNEIIAKLDDGKNVRYLDLSDKFLQPDKSLSKEIMPDFLHLSDKGYLIWADGMQPLLDEMMK